MMKYKFINFKTIVAVIVDIGIIFFLIVAVKNLDIKSAFFGKSNNFAPAILGVISYVFALSIRAGMYTKRLDTEMTISEALNIIVIGNCANLVLPFRLANSIVRGRLYPKRFKDMPGRKKYIAFSIIISDAICIYVTAVLAIVFGGFIKNEFKLKLIYVLIGALALFIVALIIISFITRMKDYAKIFLNLDLFYITIINFLSRLMIYISICIGLFSIESNIMKILSWALIIMVTSNLTMLVPISPGAIGIFEYGVIYALLQTGTEVSLATAAAVLIHIIQYLAQLPLGIILYIKREINKRIFL